MSNPFLTYINGKSFLHKLDPRTKIITLMILSIIIFNTARIWSLLSIFAIFILAAVIARISIKKMFSSVKPMMVFISIVFLLHFIFAPAPVFSDVGITAHVMDSQFAVIDEKIKIHYLTGENGEGYYLQTAPNALMPTVISWKEISNRFEGENEIKLIYLNYETGRVIIERIYSIEILETYENEGDSHGNFIIATGPASGKEIHWTQPTAKLNILPEKSISIYPSMYSFITGIGIALKFTLLILFASLMAATTKQSDLIMGIEKLVRPIPLKWADMTSHDLALMMMLTIRFIPLLISTSSQINDSTRSRAFNPARNPFKTIKIMATGLVNSIIKFADDVSKAMQSRGYVGVGKTSMNELKFKPRDAVFFSAFVLLMFCVIMSVGWIQYSVGTF